MNRKRNHTKINIYWTKLHISISENYPCGATDENGLRVEREFINTIAYYMV